MTGRQVVEMAFRHERPPRVPVALVAGGEWYVHAAGKRFARIKHDPQQIADVFIQAYRELGHDLMWTGAGFLNYPIHCLGCPIEDDTSATPKLAGTVIERLADIDRLEIATVLGHPVMQSLLQAHRRVAEAIGRETVILPTFWGPLTVAARILGVEAVMMAAVEAPDGLHGLLRFTTDLLWALSDPLLAHADIAGINYSDPVASGDMISPAMFRQFTAPYLSELVERVKGRGKSASLHICGDTTRVLTDILAIGPTCFSLESKVELQAARQVLGGKVCVLGNISPTGVFLNGTPAAVIAEGRACLAAWGDAPGFILTVGCDFPRSVPVENVQALMSLKSSVLPE